MLCLSGFSTPPRRPLGGVVQLVDLGRMEPERVDHAVGEVGGKHHLSEWTGGKSSGTASMYIINPLKKCL